jgi:GntR family transcriptional repressor for pyruvate dehydrogenase complex
MYPYWALSEPNQTNMLDHLATYGDATSTRLKSDSNRQAIYRSLRSSIVEGHLPFGTRLPTERALASRFGAARNTVRKTMNQLADEGLIVRHVGRGTFVARDLAKNTSEAGDEAQFSLGELLEARLMFEPALAELVAERASDDDLAGLSAHLEALRNAATWTEFKEAKYALHLAIVRASRNNFLISVFETIIAARRKSGWGRPGGHPLPISAVREAAARDNAAIVEALRKRDPLAARELISAYLLRTLVSASDS